MFVIYLSQLNASALAHIFSNLGVYALRCSACLQVTRKPNRRHSNDQTEDCKHKIER